MSTVSRSRFLPPVQPGLTQPITLASLNTDYASYLSTLDDYKYYADPSRQRSLRNGDPSFSQAQEVMMFVAQKLQEIALLRADLQQKNVNLIVDRPFTPNNNLSKPKKPKKLKISRPK